MGKKYFISYNSNDRQSAKWIAGIVEELGHDIIIDLDLGPGGGIASWMHDNLQELDHLIAVVSEEYLAGEYASAEWQAVFMKDPTGKQGLIIPVIVKPCELPGLLAQNRSCDLSGESLAAGEVKLRAFLEERAAVRQSGAADNAIPAAAAALYQDQRLPTPHSDQLFGRASELGFLDTQWASHKDRNIVALIAEGGTGKSFLVAKWLASLRTKEPRPYAGAARLFTWSFYSQGSRGQVTSPEEFFAKLLESFGQPSEGIASYEKMEQALEYTLAEPMVLVLDGVEPLQAPAGGMDAGRVTGNLLADFLDRLTGQDWPGLAIVTSRQKLVSLRQHEGRALLTQDINTLKPADGAALLASFGVHGTDKQMQAASAEMSGHAFGLVLLGNYLATFCAGDVNKRDLANLFELDDAAVNKAKAMLGKYAAQFGENSKETALLKVLGLFDRPAPIAAIEKVLEDPAIPGLTEPLAGQSARQLAPVLKTLKDQRLITRPDEGEVDGHPLVREYSGERLREDQREAWQAAHGRLYDWFCGLPEDDQPSTPEALMPLYQALHHGVAAGRAQEALVETYYRRVNRDEAYAVHKLGLFGTELAALAPFFEQDWNEPMRELSEPDQGVLLNKAAFTLRALGRLQEAVRPFAAGVERDVAAGRHKGAAQDSSNLSELHLTLGQIAEAQNRAGEAVRLIDKTEDTDWQLVLGAAHADALHQAGDRSAAGELFEEAERRQNESQPAFPYLYSLRGFLYVDFLLGEPSPSHLAALRERVETTLQWMAEQNLLLDIALDTLNLARIHHLQGKIPKARSGFDQAIAALQKAGTRHHLPRGHLHRAAFRRTQDNLPGAWADLARVREISQALQNAPPPLRRRPGRSPPAAGRKKIRRSPSQIRRRPSRSPSHGLPPPRPGVGRAGRSPGASRLIPAVFAV